jgi:hypothetical protein
MCLLLSLHGQKKPCSVQEHGYVSELDTISSESDQKQGHYVGSTILENDEHHCTSAENLDDEGSVVKDYLQGRSYDVLLALSEEDEEWMSENEEVENWCGRDNSDLQDKVEQNKCDEGDISPPDNVGLDNLENNLLFEMRLCKRES